MTAVQHRREYAMKRFAKDTENHKMEVLKNDDLYRHLKFTENGSGSSVYRFDIITWPGYLAIVGDMGESVFTRSPDMIQFFRSAQRNDDPANALAINPRYWAEKCAANDGDKLEFRSELFEQLVKEKFDEFIAENMVESEDGETEAQPEWASDLWIDLKGEVLSLANETVDEAIRAMMEYRPDNDTGYASFGFSEAWEYASSLQDYTFHFYWRLYAIAHAVKQFDAYVESMKQPAEPPVA